MPVEGRSVEGMGENRRVPEYSSITALDRLIDDLPVGEARRRQLGMVRGELLRALARDALPIGARRSLRRLLQQDALHPYLRIAESGVLRARLVKGARPPTSEPTNEIRRQCVDVLREAIGLPGLRLAGGALSLRPTPEFGDLAALRNRLDQDLAGYLSPGRTRLTAVLALILDAAPRSGELVGLRLAHLAPDHRAVYLERHPQHGISQPEEGDWFVLSPLGRAALDRWLPLRRELVERAHGTTKLWVSLRPNHTGLLDDEGRATLRPPGLPLEENGLITSYRRGRAQYDLTGLLPAKPEQLRRAVIAETPPLVATPDHRR
jgi:integrase